MSLDQEIAERRSEIHSDGYPMSIGELINLYRDKELDIHPEFQRYYRWTEEQKSRLVESILLGIPIPSIFVSQREDGVWDVIDGLQRLSTIFELVGILEDEKGNPLPPLALKKTRYLPSLEGKLWENEPAETAIGNTNQLIIRRSKIDVKIILRESNDASKYELFQRLNTGGAQLSDQEIRNVMLIMANPDAYNWIAELAKDESFQTCVSLSDRAQLEQYDVELVTRFLVFRRLEEEELKSIGDIGEFISDRMLEIAQATDFENTKEVEGNAFRFTFQSLCQALEDRCFRKYDLTKGRHLGGFSISAFEPMALGLGFNYEHYSQGHVDPPNIESISKKIWEDEDFLKHSGSGVRASSRIPIIIPLGRKLFAPCQ